MLFDHDSTGVILKNDATISDFSNYGWFDVEYRIYLQGFPSVTTEWGNTFTVKAVCTGLSSADSGTQYYLYDPSDGPLTIQPQFSSSNAPLDGKDCPLIHSCSPIDLGDGSPVLSAC